jgi:hypothetical protein
MNDTPRRTLESLADMRLPELQARFAEIVGEPTRSPNKTFLLRRITEALETREREATAKPTPPTTVSEPTAAKVKLTKLSVAEIQAMYREVVGRETRSSNSAYLVWKLRQAQKGRVRVGPIERRTPGAAATVKGPAAPHDLRRGRRPRRGVAPARLQEPDGDDPQGDRGDAGIAPG